MIRLKGLGLGQILVRIFQQASPRLCSKRYARLPSAASSPPPKGHLTVYVGEWMDMEEEEERNSRRYVIPVIQINHPLFWELLKEAEAEFEFQHPRGITIPCSVSRFEHVTKNISATRSPSLPRKTLRLIQSFML